MDENPMNPNAAPIEPQAPVTPAGQPLAPEPTTGPTTQEPIQEPPVMPQAPIEPMGSVVGSEPKKKKGLIILIVALILLIGGIVACILIFSNSPEKDAQIASMKFYDTMSAILSPEASTAENKNIKIDGIILASIKSNNEKNTDIGASLKLEANDAANARALVSLDSGDILTDAYADNEISAEVREIPGDNIYLKLNGISSIVSSLLKGNNESTFDISSAVDGIDGKWIELDLDKVAEMSSSLMGSYTSSVNTRDTGSQTKCLAGEFTAEKIMALIDPEDLASALSLVVYNGDKKFDSGTTYTLSINAEGAAKLLNNYYKKYQEKMEEVANKCELGDSYKNTLYEDKEVKAEDIEEQINNIPEILVVVDNKEITYVYVEYSNEKVTASIEMSISYPGSIEIEKPATPKPLSELISDIMGIVVDTSGLSTSAADTARRDFYMQVGADVTNYISNNSGKLPTTDDEKKEFLKDYISENEKDPDSEKPYTVIIRENSGIASDEFNLNTGEVVVEYGPGIDCAGGDQTGSRFFRVLGYLDSGVPYCTDN